MVTTVRRQVPAWADGLTESFPIPIEHLSLEEQQALDLTIDDEPIFDDSTVNFLGLPSELRNRIYYLVLFSKPEYRRKNGKRRSTRMSILLSNKRIHAEATYVLYTRHSFRIFTLQDFNPKPSISDLPPQYQKLVTNLELTLGSSWTKPPKDWRVSPRLARCLGGLDSVQTLRIFIELDPSHPVFARYRISLNFYTDFCGELMSDILAAMPQLKFIELDGNPSVQKNGPLVTRLYDEADAKGKIVKWGRERNWAHDWIVFVGGHTKETIEDQRQPQAQVVIVE
jgi:hypothetical protein